MVHILHFTNVAFIYSFIEVVRSKSVLQETSVVEALCPVSMIGPAFGAMDVEAILQASL
jgi:hypothetical protein